LVVVDALVWIVVVVDAVETMLVAFAVTVAGVGVEGVVISIV
jgi:hypothetical protein